MSEQQSDGKRYHFGLQVGACTIGGKKSPPPENVSLGGKKNSARIQGRQNVLYEEAFSYSCRPLPAGQPGPGLQNGTSDIGLATP